LGFEQLDGGKAMSSVYEENENKCPVCGSMNTGFDLSCNTNEQELDCHDCHYAAHTRIVKRQSGKLFWEVLEQFPLDENGVVRRRPNSVLDILHLTRPPSKGCIMGGCGDPVAGKVDDLPFCQRHLEMAKEAKEKTDVEL
jgi:hypothetical protein